MLNVARALWLCSALMPGFGAAVLWQMTRDRIAYCAVSGNDAIPAALNSWPNLIAGMSASVHFIGAAIFLPVMALALVVPANRVWLAVGAAFIWMVAVLVHLGLAIPESCEEAGRKIEALSLYVFPAVLAFMMLSRLSLRKRE